MAFSITSAVERVFTIIELVDLICEHSPRCPRYGTTEWTQWSIYSFIDASSPGVSSYGALPVLARTTRFLSKRALRVLWGRLDSFWPLLRLLPCDLLDVGEGPSYLVEQSRPEYEVRSFPMPLAPDYSRGLGLGSHFVRRNRRTSFVISTMHNLCNTYPVLKRKCFLSTLLTYLHLVQHRYFLDYEGFSSWFLAELSTGLNTTISFTPLYENSFYTTTAT